MQVLEDLVVRRGRHEGLPLRAGQLELAGTDDDEALRTVLADDGVACLVVLLQENGVGVLRRAQARVSFEAERCSGR